MAGSPPWCGSQNHRRDLSPGYGRPLRDVKAPRAAIDFVSTSFPTCYGTEFTRRAILEMGRAKGRRVALHRPRQAVVEVLRVRRVRRRHQLRPRHRAPVVRRDRRAAGAALRRDAHLRARGRLARRACPEPTRRLPLSNRQTLIMTERPTGGRAGAVVQPAACAVSLRGAD